MLSLDISGLTDVENLKLPNPTLLDYYTGLKNREIWVYDVADDLVDFAQQIINWNREDEGIEVEERQPIKVFINSNGGSLNAAMTFVTMCKLSKTPVYTFGLGKCYSAGGLILMGAARPGNRYVLPTCEILIHDGATGASGDTAKVMDALLYTQKVEEQTKEYILNCTRIEEKEYDQNYRRDWWMFADEAVEKGVADRIVTSIDELIL